MQKPARSKGKIECPGKVRILSSDEAGRVRWICTFCPYFVRAYAYQPIAYAAEMISAAFLKVSAATFSVSAAAFFVPAAAFSVGNYAFFVSAAILVPSNEGSE